MMNNEKLIVDNGCWIMHDGYWMMDNGSAKKFTFTQPY